jgi:hypothetical protein
MTKSGRDIGVPKRNHKTKREEGALEKINKGMIIVKIGEGSVVIY